MAKEQGKKEKTNDPVSTEGQVVSEQKTKKIMTQPLPQILDEIEDSIRFANEAARDARKAAEEARQAGEKAANEAARVAAEAISKAEAAIPAAWIRKLLGSWEFIVFVTIAILSAVFASVALSIGLTFL